MAKLPNPHPAGCFWHDFTEKVGTPNVKWCEPTLCGIISEPANTWSNLGYLVLSIWFWWVGRSTSSKLLRLFAPTAFLIGLFSFVYHASNNYLTQVFDFVGMFLYVYLLVMINFRRLGWVSKARQWWLYWGLVLGSVALTHILYLVEIPYQGLIAVGVVLILTTEMLRWRAGDRERYHYWALVVSFVMILVAESFSLLDVTRTWCQPENTFLHGHAIWHLLSAVSIGFAFVHYRQMDID